MFYLLVTFVTRRIFNITSVANTCVTKLVVSGMRESACLRSGFSALSCLLLSPMFFTDVNLGMGLPRVSMSVVVFTIILAIITILAGVINYKLNTGVYNCGGCRTGQVKIKVVSHNRITLVMTDGNSTLKLVDSSVLKPIVMIIIVAAIVAPVLLGMIFTPKAKPSARMRSTGGIADCCRGQRSGE